MVEVSKKTFNDITPNIWKVSSFLVSWESLIKEVRTRTKDELIGIRRGRRKSTHRRQTCFTKVGESSTERSSTPRKERKECGTRVSTRPEVPDVVGVTQTRRGVFLTTPGRERWSSVEDGGLQRTEVGPGDVVVVSTSGGLRPPGTTKPTLQTSVVGSSFSLRELELSIREEWMGPRTD